MDKKKMFFESPSGFMMPFVGADVEIVLGYGEQVHPMTGEKFFHHGIDFSLSHVPLLALASGMVVGVGTDAVHGQYVIIRYGGGYDVKYGHIDRSFVSYGNKVTAGRQVATSGDFLHLGVTFDGESLDPSEFLAVIFSNVCQLESLGIKSQPQLVTFDVPVHTDYDGDREEIEQLMGHFLPSWFQDLSSGSYRPTAQLESALRDAFVQSADRNYFFETVPCIGNPLGLSARSGDIVGRIQSLLISDFLRYLAQRHHTFLSSWNEEEKKKLLTVLAVGIL